MFAKNGKTLKSGGENGFPLSTEQILEALDAMPFSEDDPELQDDHILFVMREAHKELGLTPDYSTYAFKYFEKWLNAVRDFVNAIGQELKWCVNHIQTAFRYNSNVAERTLAIAASTGYGAQALKRDYPKNLLRGLFISLTLHFTILCIYLGITYFTKSESSVRTIRITLYPELDSQVALEKNRREWATSDKESFPSLVLPVDHVTQPPGPNLPEDTSVTDVPIVDVAGLQELVNQGIPSSIAGTGTTPLLHFVPKPEESPKIDLASVGGENGIILPPMSTPGEQGRVLYSSTSSDSFNPKLQVAGGSFVGGTLGDGNRYHTGRTGSLSSAGDGRNGNGRPGRPAIDRQAEPGHPDRIPLKNVGENDWKSRDLKKLFHELVEWMEANQYGFPPAVKHYMRYKPGDVTSCVTIATTEANYELFLLCNDASEDFGLLLVAAGDSAQTICLRDTGFRQQSFYLSKGIVGRNENAVVSSLSMLEQRPTFHETSKFYNIFLSWWDKTKAEARKK